jgi:hypothetical protein
MDRPTEFFDELQVEKSLDGCVGSFLIEMKQFGELRLRRTIVRYGIENGRSLVIERRHGISLLLCGGSQEQRWLPPADFAI